MWGEFLDFNVPSSAERHLGGGWGGWAGGGGGRQTDRHRH